jgi:hypothetical protein
MVEEPVATLNPVIITTSDEDPNDYEKDTDWERESDMDKEIDRMFDEARGEDPTLEAPPEGQPFEVKAGKVISEGKGHKVL